MTKVLKDVWLVAGIWNIVSKYPAVTAGLFNVIVVLAAALGLHLSASELAGFASFIAAVFAGLVHAGVIPTSKVDSVNAGIKSRKLDLVPASMLSSLADQVAPVSVVASPEVSEPVEPKVTDPSTPVDRPPFDANRKVLLMTENHTYLRHPNAVAETFTPLQVAAAYNYPAATGAGLTAGVIELGGGFGQADLTAYFGSLGLAVPKVVAKSVNGGTNTSDGPNGADGEVLLDIEVLGAIAPAATINVYFAPNTDSGFIAAINAAVADKVNVISISWGGPESSWAAATVKEMEAALAAARAAGIMVFVASGDSGSSDGTKGKAVDYPASSPNVCGTGGTKLTVNAAGKRATEVVWDDSTTEATGGGVSVLFPGRDVPDVAGNADPNTGYEVTVDGENLIIGGTSAVAPLYAGLYLRLLELTGAPFDLVSVVAGNASVCFDVTSGNNGAYRAGPGRDEDTGFGVVDGTLLLDVLKPIVTPPPTTDPDETLLAAIKVWEAAKGLS